MRGVIEGFYGSPWSRAARLEVLEAIAGFGMNAYVYAPKSDPLHRDRWRDPYDDPQLAHFADLAQRGDALGVRVGFAISPGVDIAYDRDADRVAVLAKLTPLLDRGVDWFVLALDDIPARPGLGREHAALAGWLLDALRAAPGAASPELTLVPTEYVGTGSSPYLTELAAGLPESVAVMWTGTTVCSPTITAAQARARAEAVGGRRPLVWDNFPVNDGPMERALHLGPYRGREPALAGEVSGVLCNPMIQPRASLVALATAADWMRAPDRYDSDTAWTRAVDVVAAPDRRPALRALAHACEDGPLCPPAETRVQRLVDRLGLGLEGDHAEARDQLRELFDTVRTEGRAWAAEPDALGEEVAPWLAAARREAKAGLAALGLLDALDVQASAEDLLVHAFATLLAWGTARAGGEHLVFGPRFAVYPAVVQLTGGAPGLDVDLAVVEDASAIDRVCRHALRVYRHATPSPPDVAPGAPER